MERLQAGPPPRLAALQKQFADHIRDPDHTPAPTGMEERRMAIYRRLFFGNLDHLLSSQFSRLRALYDDTAWRAVIRDFMARHRSRTPLFPELPGEFLRYLQTVRDHPGDPPFLVELAHFEWLRRALRLDERDPAIIACDPEGDPGTGIPVLSPLATLASYRYPVHRIEPSYQPQEAPDTPTLLLLYRNLDERVGELKLNPVSARLFQLLAANRDRHGLQLLERIAAELNHPAPETVVAHGRDVLEDFHRRDIILGTKNNHGA